MCQIHPWQQIRAVGQPQDSQDLLHHSPRGEGLFLILPKGSLCESESLNESEWICRLLLGVFWCTRRALGLPSRVSVPSRGTGEALPSLK